MGGLLSGMPLLASVAPPSGWVPARWNGTNPQTLDLLSGAPINCLLLSSYTPEFVTRATARGIITLAVLKPGADPADPARKAIRAGLQGIVLEGDFPTGTAARVRDTLADAYAIVVELTSRAHAIGRPGPHRRRVSRRVARHTGARQRRCESGSLRLALDRYQHGIHPLRAGFGSGQRVARISAAGAQRRHRRALSGSHRRR